MIINKIRLLWSLLLMTSFAVHAQVNTDSLWAVWSDETQAVTTRLEAIKSIDFDEENNFISANNVDTALYHCQLGYELANANGLNKWMAEILIYQGNLYADWQQNLQKGRACFIQSKAIGEEIGDDLVVGRSSFNLGLGYMKQADFANGFPAIKLAATLFEENGAKELQARALELTAFLYSQQNDLKTSNEYLAQALAIREELIKTNDTPIGRMTIAGMKQTIASQQAQLGTNNNEVETVEPIEKDSLARNPFALPVEELEAYLREYSEDLNSDPNDPRLYFLRVSNIAMKAQIHLEEKDTSKAIPYLEEALALAQVEGELSTTAWILATLYEAYYSSGQYRKSLNTFQELVSYRDSIQNMENARAVIQEQFKSEYEQQKIIDDLENANQLAIETQKKENQQKLSIAIGIGLLLISLLAFGIFNRLKVTRQQKAIIEEQKKKVEQSEKYKEQFLANMSHEIRTPMHAISGMVKILERNEHPSTQNIYLDAMRTSSDNLVVILNDVLDLSKIEAGKLDIESIPLEPVAVIENVIQILRFKAEEKGLILNAQVDDDVPAIVMGDPTRMNQILVNLAGNAIKFTEKGIVDICLSKENNRLRFSVRDTGVGIPTDKVTTIFDAFEQVKDSTSRIYGGTGLGLSISKQLIELQAGQIWVESELGKGSTFYVELPLIAAVADATGQNHITEEQLKAMAASLKGIRILLAEDNAFNQMIAQDDLSFYIEKIKIDTVENGDLVIEKFKAENYDLILMDVQMPGTNGFEATRKIRELEKIAGKEKGIPIIAMTASLLKSEVENCYEAGMDSYIPKPYKSEELIGPIYAAWEV